MKNIYKKSGFTLVEIIVIIGTLSLIMISLTGILSGVFNSQKKNQSNDTINQQGNWIIDEIKKNLMNASSVGFSCPVGIGQSIGFQNVKNGNVTVLGCLGTSGDYRIASSSANSATLFTNNGSLKLTDCTGFVSCEILPSSEVSDVKIKFKLEYGESLSPIYVSKDFELNVTLRN